MPAAAEPQPASLPLSGGRPGAVVRVHPLTTGTAMYPVDAFYARGGRLAGLHALGFRSERIEIPIQEQPGPNPEVVRYNLQRADILQRIVAKAKPEDRDQWLRQQADCLSAAVLSSAEGDRTGYERLLELEKQVAKNQPGSPVAAYLTFREMQADFALRPVKGTDSAKSQEQLLQRPGLRDDQGGAHP